jgi:enediyne biosynthesis protein E4
MDEYGITELSNGKKRKEEFYQGSGYLSSSGRTIVKGPSIEKIKISNRKNRKVGTQITKLTR